MANRKDVIITVKAKVPEDADNEMLGQALQALLDACDSESLDTFADYGMEHVDVTVLDN
jgi:hypothetical protein